MKQILTTLALLCITLLPAVAEPYTQTPPPKLVECKSATNCDRDPKQLEAFVEGFYKWYVDSRQEYFSQLRKTNSEKEKKIIDENHYKNEQKTLTTTLSHNFKQWYTFVMDSYDGEFPAPFCKEQDSDPVLCLIHAPDQWLSPISASVSAMDWDSCTIALYLPEWRNDQNVKNPPFTLTLRLKVENNFWRIDGVTDRLHSGK